MHVRIAGKTIYGTIMPVRLGPRELHTVRTHYAGLAGVSEIQLATGLRQIQVEMLVHRRFTQSQLLQVIDRLTKGLDNSGWIGTNGRLEIRADAIVHLQNNCTFEGLQITDPAPQPDLGRMLDGGWYCAGVALFTQLL